MKKKLCLWALVLSVVFFSCKKDDEVDGEKPVFNSVKMNNVEMLTAEESEVANGEYLTFTISVQDNVALSELSVEVHEAGDGHEHERILKSGDDALVFGPKIYDLGGTQTKTVEVKVSDSLAHEATDYHLVLILLDKESNRTTTIQVFEIE